MFNYLVVIILCFDVSFNDIIVKCFLHICLLSIHVTQLGHELPALV